VNNGLGSWNVAVVIDGHRAEKDCYIDVVVKMHEMKAGTEPHSIGGLRSIFL
jgi:hypothetical protein